MYTRASPAGNAALRPAGDYGASARSSRRRAEHQDYDVVISAELQRRSLSRLSLLTWASWAMIGPMLIGLTPSGPESLYAR